MRLCLNMIVKNEIANLDRCLRSVVGVIDCWCIADTGSTDGTQEFIRQFFSSRGLPGLLVAIPFHHFAQARNEALDACRGSDLDFDYILLADADMEISVEDPLFKQGLSADIYMVIQRAGISYYNRRILRRTIPSCYRGVTHEFLEASGSVATLDSISFIDHASGSNRKDKFARDIRLLLRALDTEGDAGLKARYTFYLAQSYRDNGQMEKAITAYQRRAAMGGWDEEVWYSLYQVARLHVLGRAPAATIVAAFEQAYEARPTRAEPLCDLAEYLRNNKRHALAHLVASRAKDIRRPSDILFIRDDVYAWRSLDEFAISAYWVGDFVSSAEACRTLLASPATPAEQHGRIRENLRFALARIEQQAAATGGKQAKPMAQIPRSAWVPNSPAAGTELMVAGLKQRLGMAVEKIDLKINHPGPASGDARPRLVWIHHDMDQAYMQWCNDKSLVESVACFVFVSYWQRERYLSAFGLPPERCVVLRNATDVGPDLRSWEAGPVWRCAYTSTPFRGLSVLLDAWERLVPSGAELNIWSSMKLYKMDDDPYIELFERAQSIPGVIYHGIVPNSELRAALRTVHFLTYPSTFAETSCLSVIEAMAAGCRVIVPSLGALPETTCGYAHVSASSSDAAVHARSFSNALQREFERPWGGASELALMQQRHCAAVYDWRRHIKEWRQLIDSV